MALYRDVFLKLARHKIKYLVAGGFAVNFHQVQRATMDLDLIVHLEEKNTKKFITVMNLLGFKPRVPVDATDFANDAIRQKWIKDKEMQVFSFFHLSNPYEIIDVFVHEPKPFAELKKNAIYISAFGIRIPVTGLRDLIEMKKSAGRDKDKFDVAQLKKKLQWKKNPK